MALWGVPRNEQPKPHTEKLRHRLLDLEHKFQAEALTASNYRTLAAPPAPTAEVWHATSIPRRGGIWHNNSVKEFACEATLPAEHMLSRQAVAHHGGSVYQIKGTMRLCYNSNTFEFGVTERARPQGSNQSWGNDPLSTVGCSRTDHTRRDYLDSTVVAGKFEHVASDRYTFWCESSTTAAGKRMSFSQFEGCMHGDRIELAFPYQTRRSLESGPKGPWSLRGIDLIRTLRAVPSGPPRLCPRAAQPVPQISFR